MGWYLWCGGWRISRSIALPARMVNIHTGTGLRRLVANAVSLLASEAMNRAGTFVVYLLVGRALGQDDFGRLSLALVFFQVVQTIASAGLRTIVSRSTARDPRSMSSMFSNGVLLAVITSTILAGGLVLLLPLLGYAASTREVISILAIGAIPFGVSAVAEGALHGLERMHLIAYANLAANIVKVGVAAALLAADYSLLAVAAVFVASHVISSLAKVLAVSRQPEFAWVKPTRSVGLKVGGEMSTFAAMRIVQAVLSSVDVIVISLVSGEAEVALVAAALQLLVPIALLFETTGLATFPAMCRHATHPAGMRRFSASILELLLLAVMPLALAAAVFAEPLLTTIYGQERFGEAAELLQLLAWILVLRTINHTLGQTLLATGKERTTLRILVVTAISALILSPLLIGLYGVVGAALSALLVRCISSLQHIFATRHLLGARFLPRVLWIPAAATTAAAGAIFLGRSFPSIAQAMLGFGTFVLVAVLLELLSAGGRDGVRRKLVAPLQELTTAPDPIEALT